MVYIFWVLDIASSTFYAATLDRPPVTLFRCKNDRQSMPWPNMVSVFFRSCAVNDGTSSDIIWLTLYFTSSLKKGGIHSGDGKLIGSYWVQEYIFCRIRMHLKKVIMIYEQVNIWLNCRCFSNTWNIYRTTKTLPTTTENFTISCYNNIWKI